jgi:hypothetical protein
VFIAHLPASYLVSAPLLDRLRLSAGQRRRLLRLGLMAGLLPDLDLLWFYLVDHRRHVHHTYLPHLPAAWAVALLAAALVLGWLRAARAAWAALLMISLNVFLHLALDTAAGGIRWLWPLSDRELVMSTVRPRFHPWYMNFVLHWTFALELALSVAALVLWLRRRAESLVRIAELED